MKENRMLCEHWELKKIAPCAVIDPWKMAEDKEEWLAVKQMPAQVQDVLLAHGLLPEEVLVGWCQEAVWIADYDWVYRLWFEQEDAPGIRLLFEGLDTFADIWVNGNLVHCHDNFYLPAQVEAGGMLTGRNCLLLHFHRTKDRLDSLVPEERWEGVMRCKLIRKPVHDFPPETPAWGSNYQGAVPYFTPIGVYRDITLQRYETAEFTETGVRTSVDERYDGVIHLDLQGISDSGDVLVEYRLRDQENRQVLQGELAARTNAEGFSVQCRIPFAEPVLWQPRGFGAPYLYQLELRVFESTGTISPSASDIWHGQIGFKHVRMPSPLEFLINGNRVRLWGGSLDPLQGYTHCFVRERAERLFDMIENAHFNTLRIWGEGIPFPDEFYEMADQRGILIWQEFFMGHGGVPDSPHYVEEYKKEAAALIRRLRHRPCLLMWCGGNETIMGAEFYGFYPFGKQVLEEEFPKVVEALDPGRYYHPNSPYGGEWANDPRAGDYHTYDCVWEYPYKAYPNFISEHIRTSPPVVHSLKRMIKGPLWEQDYDTRQLYGDAHIMPENWVERSCQGALGERKTGAFWEYYDAGDEEELSYRFGASYGQEIRRYGEQIRRGCRELIPGGNRSKGYLTCKLLDTWPKIYCSTIDFFQEGYIPYYTVARLFRPVMLSFAKEDSIKLWVVNDSSHQIKGKVTYGLYHLGRECFVQSNHGCETEISVGQGEAAVVFDLAEYRFFSKDCLLFAELEDDQGQLLDLTVDYVDIERHLKFPPAQLTVRLEGNELEISSDRFVRCVEIKGLAQGSGAAIQTGAVDQGEFGWLFSDNYFDLMPDKPKRVRILGKKESGVITVKGHYLKDTKRVGFARKGEQPG